MINEDEEDMLAEFDEIIENENDGKNKNNKETSLKLDQIDIYTNWVIGTMKAFDNGSTN